MEPLFFSYLEKLCYLLLLFCFVPLRVRQELEHYETEFVNYIKDFNKTYDNKSEYELRFEAFKKSLQNINVLNSKRMHPEDAKYGLTKFSDFPEDEFEKRQLLDFNPRRMKFNRILNKLPNTSENGSKENRRFLRSIRKSFPKKVDWRNKCTEIKDQLHCGACWAFSTIQTIESLMAIKYGKLEKYSVQQMIDCSENNYGCDGGDICILLDWLTSNKIKVVKEKDYPLTLNDQNCKEDVISNSTVEVIDYECASFIDSEEVLLELLANLGPIMVSVNARTWQNYVSGIIQFHCDSHFDYLNHAVQIVGYDISGDIPFYIVRNTWGKNFGDQGYVYLSYGKNICGMAHEVAAFDINLKKN